jgi:hypothetical protein
MRWSIFPLTVLAMACQDSKVTKFNANPTATITSHSDGDTVREGIPEILRGQVGDPDHGIGTLEVQWTVGETLVCTDSVPDEDGLVDCEASFDLGEGGQALLAVSDPDGGSGTARITLDVQATDAPTAAITSPTADGVYYSDQLITFQGTVSDTEDATEDLVVTWETQEMGDLGLDIDLSGEGRVESFSTLEEGEHAVRLRAVDSSGKDGVDSVVITVGPPNSAPTCAITAPETDSAGPEGETVTFEASVDDVDIPANQLMVSWASDKDGPIGDSTPTSSGEVIFPVEGLTVNTHVISMTVTDELGLDCAANVVYSVGTPPTLTVTAPTDGSTLTHGDTVMFEATVDDNEDLPNEVALRWESDIDGEFSTDGADSAGEATVSISTLSAGDHVVTVTATDTDGLYVTDTVSFTLNEPPTAPTVTVTPDPAYTNNILVASATGSEDPDGSGTVTYRYDWYEDGVPSTESASATFPAASTGKHHTYRVEVTPNDGDSDGAIGWAEVTVTNSEPVLAGPTLSAATARSGDRLTCSATVTDVDLEDSPTLTYAWSDGTTGDTYMVSLDDAVDATITCTATADDADGGVVSASASAIVTNTDPVVDTVTVTPATAKVGDVLTCSATASDADGETPTISYEWNDGSTASSYTIVDTDNPGDTITCTATATDERATTDSRVATATVENTVPVMGTVTVSPDTAVVGDILTCSATATDADGESPTISYEWSTGTVGDIHAVTSDDDPGDTITCTATATDTDGGSASASDSATVENTGPVMGSVTISPDPAYNDDTVRCTASATDADGETPTITYEWSTGYTEPEWTLTAATAPGDTITCTATATDGSSATDSGSASITVSNRSPDAGSVTITPESPRTSDEITCATSGEGDPDGESLAVSYSWDVNGTPADSTSSTLGTGHEKGDVITCSVTVTDESDATETASASVTIGNTLPNVSAILLSPSDLYTNDTLTAVPTVSDADGDELTVTYAFSVNGDVVQDSESDSLSGTGFFDKDDTVSVIVTADDREGIDTRASDTVTVLNSPPTAPEVSITETIKTCNAIDLHGGSSELRVPSSDDWDFGDNAFTIEMWVKPNASHRQALFAFENDYKLGMDFSYGGGCGGVSLGVNVWASSTGDGWNLLTADSGGGSAGCGRIPLSLDEWHHVAFVRDGNRWMSFVNGELDVDVIKPGSVVDREEELRVGSWGWDRVTHFDGAIDDFRVSSVARYTADFTATSDYEVDEHTLGLWTFSEGEGTSSTDETSSHEASLEAGASWVPDCPEGGDTRYLVCSIDEESTDADGDAIAYTFDWDVDGSPFTGTDTTTYDDDTIPGDALGSEETWTCEATPNDGEDNGEYASATYDVLPTCVPSTEFYWLDGVSSDAGSYHPWMIAEYGCGYGYDHRTATTDNEWCVAYYHDYAGGCSDKKWVALDCAASSNGRICERSGTSGCSGSTFDGSCYSYQSHSGDWYDARSACEDWGGDLVSASTDAEGSFVQSMLPYGHSRAWIGVINATGASECF